MRFAAGRANEPIAVHQGEVTVTPPAPHAVEIRDVTLAPEHFAVGRGQTGQSAVGRKSIDSIAVQGRSSLAQPAHDPDFPGGRGADLYAPNLFAVGLIESDEVFGSITDS